MSMLLRDTASGLYVGVHSTTFYKLQDREHAYVFNSMADLKDSISLFDEHHDIDLEVVVEDASCEV